ncbi:MAG: TonB family protein [Terracidiphilus sp.]|jgi:peptidyl-prolyl cis-trans isomerase A (cyclophilin A)
MKLRQTLLVPALATAFAAAAYAQTSTKPAEEIPDAPTATAAAMTHPNGPTVVMDTSMGRITCQFFQRQAPNAVANFIALAEGTRDWTDPTTRKVQHHKRYFDGTIFHRVIPEFMIQGGDPAGTGSGDPGYSFADEFDPNLNFDVPGRLAMANSGPNTNGSQFFITEVPTEHLNQIHTIFGQCDESSILVVKTIARVEQDSQNKPLTPVVLKKVTIVREGQPLPPVPDASTPEAAAHKPVRISGPEQPGMLLRKTTPVYPPDAKAAGISGIVKLQAVIGTDGQVEKLKVVDGPPELQQAALDAAKTWKYRPHLLNGQPIEFETTINVDFSLDRE